MERRSQTRKPLSLAFELFDANFRLTGQSCDVGPAGLSLSVPTARLKFSPSELLDREIGLSFHEQDLKAQLKWYKLDDSAFLLGLAIASQDRARWCRLLNWPSLTQSASGV